MTLGKSRRGTILSEYQHMNSVFGSSSEGPPSSMTCPRCKKSAFHVVQALSTRAAKDGEWGNFAFDDRKDAFRVSGTQLRGGTPRSSTTLRWFASVCVACSQGCVWRGHELIYPSVSQVTPPHPDMPAAARELYEEAALVLPFSRRASAALARAALERLLKDLPGADPSLRLDDLIAALAPNVTPRLWQTITALRSLGNDTLHSDSDSELVALYLDGDAAEVAEPFFGAINAIVEEIIVQPRVANDLYSMIPPGVRTTAERKRDEEQGRER